MRMKIGERGQVVIPKSLRERYGLLPNSEIEFVEERGRLFITLPRIAKQKPKRDKWDAVVGVLKDKVADVDRDIEEMRGR